LTKNVKRATVLRMAWKELRDNDRGRFLPTWDFDDNPIFEGIYIDLRHDVGSFRKKVYQFEDDNGERWEIWGSTVIENKMALAEKGQRIRFVYKGFKQGKNTRYKDYSITVDQKEIDEEYENA